MIAAEQTQFNSNKDMVKDAVIIKTLGHPMRLNILIVLYKSERNVKHLQECLGIEQAAVSQHLAVLKSRGIIISSRRGVETHYSIANPLARMILAAINQN
jgi:ArsR family transcriptional regulator